MNEDRKLIKFLSIPSKRTVKDFLGSVCRQLNFTRTNYKEINGIFVENLQNSRFHLHIHSKGEQFKSGLLGICKSTSDPNYSSIEINKTNHLFVTPPFNNSVYRLFPMDRSSECYEKVIEYNTGIHQTIMDILIIVDSQKYKIQYVVCNRAKTYIAFINGTDAMEMMQLLRSQHFSPKFSTCYAKLIYIEGENYVRNSVPQPPVQNNYQQNFVSNVPLIPNMTQRQPQNYHIVGHHEVRQNYRNATNNTQQSNIVRRHNFVRMRQNLQHQRRNATQRRDNLRGARFVRVMLPDDIQQNAYEMHLVRRF
ncbi:uncharacterized protein [Chironomus tepperi]|uniref:uncharacterized protein n=1 Tax=Chironomus tepperi TaxID=113505 RepID=UPI00391F1A88